MTQVTHAHTSRWRLSKVRIKQARINDIDGEEKEGYGGRNGDSVRSS
jgi:hypothetical protein